MPSETSGQRTLFQEAAADLAHRLELHGDPRTDELAPKVREYEAMFATWRSVPPGPEERTRAINDFLTLSRLGLDLLGR